MVELWCNDAAGTGSLPVDTRSICGFGQFGNFCHRSDVWRRAASAGVSAMDLMGVGFYQTAAVLKHRLACGDFVGCGGRFGLRLDCIDGVTWLRGHFGADARPSKIEVKGGEMASRSVRLRGGNGFWIERCFLAAGGHDCGLAVEHFIALPRPVSAPAMEFPAGKQAIPLCRCLGLWVVVDEQSD